MPHRRRGMCGPRQTHLLPPRPRWCCCCTCTHIGSAPQCYASSIHSCSMGRPVTAMAGWCSRHSPGVGQCQPAESGGGLVRAEAELLGRRSTLHTRHRDRLDARLELESAQASALSSSSASNAPRPFPGCCKSAEFPMQVMIAAPG